MGFWDHKRMSWGHGVDIEECEKPLVLPYLHARDISAYDLAEYAFFHAVDSPLDYINRISSLLALGSMFLIIPALRWPQPSGYRSYLRRTYPSVTPWHSSFPKRRSSPLANVIDRSRSRTNAFFVTCDPKHCNR